MIGRRLAHYEVLAELGRGGMGEVYRARDAKLGRDVALKVLPREMSSDPERLARFSREARTLAALQHPNIASIYGFEEIEGVRFLVMELVEGEDLAVRLRRGALPLESALELARQIAEGLEAAHEKGIVHRDLKPANVKLTADGSIKILDFGLARAIQGEAPGDGDLANSPTITAAMTQQGVILGTAAYMSPEQARGGIADARADIWAFGVMLWEMLSGHRLFEGETVSDTLASILKLPPDWSQLPSDTPARIRELLERCLAKKRRDRLGSISDARLEIEWVLAGRGEASAAAALVPRRRSWLLAAIGLPLLLLSFLAGRMLDSSRDSSQPAAGPSLALSVRIPSELVHLGELLSPDGSCIAVRARLRDPATPAEAEQALYIRPLDRDEFRRVDASLGFRSYGFSQDGKWLGLVAPAAPNSAQMRFWRVPVDGSSPPTALFDWSESWSRLFLWLPDGDLLVDLQSTQILRIPTDGRSPGQPLEIKLPDGFTGFEVYPQHNAILPDGQHLLTWAHTYLDGRYDQTGAVLNLKSGEMKPLLRDTGKLVYWPTGHLLFARSATLMAVAFDLEKLEVRGTPIAVASGIRQYSPWDHSDFYISNDGTLSYYAGQIGGDGRRLAWLDASYQVLEPWSEDRHAFAGSVFASAKRDIVFASMTGNDGFYDIWASELNTPRLDLRIEKPNMDCDLVCISPERDLLLYMAQDDESRVIYQRDAKGIDTPLLTVSVNSPTLPACLVDQDRSLLFTDWLGVPSIRMLTMPNAADAAAIPVQPDQVSALIPNAAEPSISPDGRWLAYTSEVSGKREVYVRAWLGAGKLGNPSRVSREGGEFPDWYRAPDGSVQIRYVLSEGVYAVDFDPSTGRAGAPAVIARSLPHVFGIQHLSDGRILAVLRDEDEAPIESIALHIGFGRALAQKLAAPSR